jgi:hypothetical protein
MAWTEEQRDRAAVTRQQNKEARLREKQERMEAAGIPDSRRFGGAPGENPLMDYHVGGVKVREMVERMSEVDAALWISRLTYHQTDEGIAERNEGKSELRVEVGAGPWEKSLEHRRDDVKQRDMDSWEARDPLKEVKDRHAEPGMAYKFLSPRKIQENGGTGSYEVVKDASGEAVKVRGMVLGKMPQERAKARNRHYQDRSNRLITEMTEQYKREGGRTAVSDQ